MKERTKLLICCIIYFVCTVIWSVNAFITFSTENFSKMVFILQIITGVSFMAAAIVYLIALLKSKEKQS